MTLIGLTSYGLAAAAFLFLTLVLIAGRRGRGGARVVVASSVTCASSFLLAFAYSKGEVPAAPFWVLEFCRAMAWVAVLAGLAATAGLGRWMANAIYALTAAALAAAVLANFPSFAEFLVGTHSRWLPMLGIAVAIAQLALLEQLYRNSHAGGREVLRPLFLGLGAMCILDVFLYSEELMSVALSAQTMALRGFGYALCSPAIAIAARRNPSWSLDVFISRQIVFYSATFLAVGSYMVAMALGGFVIAQLGREWGSIPQLLFSAAGGVVLAALIASGTARNRLKVFLSKHFYSNKYDYRIEWLRFVQSFGASGDRAEVAPAMIRAVAQIFASHHGLLWVRDDEERRLVLAAQWNEDGHPAGDMAALDARSEFIEFIERRHWIIDLQELKVTPELYQNLRLPESLAVAEDLRLIVPLMHGAKLVGLLGLGPPDAPFEMSYEDRDLLKTVGRHIGTHLAQLEADRRLSENQQFEAYSRLTAFMMHDLKNLVAQLSLVVANADKHRRNPEFVDDTIDTVRNSTDRMTRLIEQLQRGEVRSLDREVSLEETLKRVIERIRERGVIPSLECPVEPVVVLADPERLAMTMEHLVRNAQDATSADGAVSLRLVRDGERAVIQVADTGLGMTAEFIRDRLFRPFDSTKGTKGMGIGVYQVRDYVRSLRGEVSVTSAPGAGTVFSITLPIANPRKER